MSRAFFLVILIIACGIDAPLRAQSRHAKHPASKHNEIEARPVEQAPLEIFGIRPGITFDSVREVMAAAGATMRLVREDSISHSYSDNPAHVYIVDSVILKLTYMRMAFVFDGNNRLRRLTITPRESSIDVGATDDIENVLLLYFGEKWGKPELDLSPPFPLFRWQTGNIMLRGFIRRGYPMWVLEG